MSDIDSLRKAVEAWKAGVDKSLAKFPERRASFVTGSGSPVGRLYTPLDLEGRDPAAEIGLPGEYPFTRGVQNAIVDREEVAGAAPLAEEGAEALVAIEPVAHRGAVAAHPEDADFAGRARRRARAHGVFGKHTQLVAFDGATERARHDLAGAVRCVDVEHLGGADAVVDLAPEALQPA